MSKVCVIGGGAAGMMAAVHAAKNGNEVHIFEQNEKFGKKIYITGKGRCNLTNACDMEELFASVQRNKKFLYSAFYAFTNEDAIRFFEDAGCPVKIERGNRAFPVSDHASDVMDALTRGMKKEGVHTHLNCKVAGIISESIKDTVPEVMDDTVDENDERTNVRIKQRAKNSKKKCNYYIKGICLEDGRMLEFDKVIVTTGGMSYPSTGSRGDGYAFARETGHDVTCRIPSLVPFVIEESYVREMQGLSLRNVEVSIYHKRKGKDKEIYRGFGEMLFTHFGVSGPLILSASSAVGEELVQEGCEKFTAIRDFRMEIDLKPALDIEQLEQRVLREFEKAQNKQFKNILGSLFPNLLIPVMINLSGISPERQINTITKEERGHFIYMIKHFPLTIRGLRGFNEAVITKGGISVKDVNPSTMESKRCKGLYFAGEVLDLDAVTGGFNLQIAWSTGYLAGNSIAPDEE